MSAKEIVLLSDQEKEIATIFAKAIVTKVLKSHAPKDKKVHHLSAHIDGQTKQF